MSRKEMILTQLGFIFWFVNINIQGMDALPDFLGIIFLGYVLFEMSESKHRPKILLLMLAVLGADHLIHWFKYFELPFELLIVRVLSACAIFMFLRTVRQRAGEQTPFFMNGIRFCGYAYIALLALDYVSLELSNTELMIAEVICSWLITLLLVVLFCGMTPKDGEPNREAQKDAAGK